ncbi:MAG: hypothetical protein ACJ72H_26295 [Candidatus Sulfotelmatobacter sp.]|jgi:hypothetical protein
MQRTAPCAVEALGWSQACTTPEEANPLLSDVPYGVGEVMEVAT